jgi:hypothetical protein
VVVPRVDEDRLGWDPGQLAHATTHLGGHVRSGEDEVAGDDREERAPIVEHERLAEHRVVDALRETGPGGPAPVGQP